MHQELFSITKTENFMNSLYSLNQSIGDLIEIRKQAELEEDTEQITEINKAINTIQEVNHHLKLNYRNYVRA